MKSKQLSHKEKKHSGGSLAVSSAFTMVELLVVVAVLAMLGCLMLPALASGTQQAEGFRCLNNLHKLVQACQMYSRDNGGKLVGTGGEGAQPQTPTSGDGEPGGKVAQWCPGRQDPGVTQLAPIDLASNLPNIGIEWIQDGMIYPYINSVRPYLCPADKSFNVIASNIYPHVRSVSINCWINPVNNSAWTGGSADGSMRIFTKESDLTVPGPANTFLLMDESSQSINDGWMIEDPSDPTIGKPIWIDGPGIYHNGAAGISFCDGHAGLKKWRDPVVLSASGMQDTQNWNGAKPKYEPDVLWLANRATALNTTKAFLGPQGW